MDPMLRLTISMWRILQRRPSKRRLVIYGGVAAVSVAIALIEWLGYWPTGWRTTGLTRELHRVIR
jgi:hypothetical protein